MISLKRIPSIKFLRTHQTSRQAFTLVEVLGAVAGAATLATVSVVSIQDSVKAGQRASVQRELQHLNTALQNFKSAGGVIPPDTSAEAAVTALQVGTNLEGSNFSPLGLATG